MIKKAIWIGLVLVVLFANVFLNATSLVFADFLFLFLLLWYLNSKHYNELLPEFRQMIDRYTSLFLGCCVLIGLALADILDVFAFRVEGVFYSSTLAMGMATLALLLTLMNKKDEHKNKVEEKKEEKIGNIPVSQFKHVPITIYSPVLLIVLSGLGLFARLYVGIYPIIVFSLFVIVWLYALEPIVKLCDIKG